MPNLNRDDLSSKSEIFQSLNVNGEVVDVSQAWLDKLGYSRDEVIGKFFGSFLDEKSLPQVKKNFPHLKDYGFVNNVPLILKMKDGTRSEAVLDGMSEYNETGEFQNTVCQIRTLHDILHSEQQVKKMLDYERYLRNFFNLKSNILQLMHNENNLKNFFDKLTIILSEPLEIQAVYIKDNENVSTNVHQDNLNAFHSLYASNDSDEIFFISKDEPAVSIDISNAFETLNAFGCLGQRISTKNHSLNIYFLLSDLLLLEEWKGGLKDVISLIDYAVKSILNKMEKDVLAERLKELSVRDPLTKAFNRNHLTDVLSQEKKTLQRYDYKLSIIMFDIDHFKMVNDTYGHPFGDHVLRELSKIVKNNIRETDTLFRYGGEEFIITLPHTDLESSIQIAEKLNNMVAEHDFGNKNKITASFGVAVYSNGEEIKDALDKVDKCLYHAKSSGRNCVKS